MTNGFYNESFGKLTVYWQLLATRDGFNIMLAYPGKFFQRDIIVNNEKDRFDFRYEFSKGDILTEGALELFQPEGTYEPQLFLDLIKPVKTHNKLRPVSLGDMRNPPQVPNTWETGHESVIQPMDMDIGIPENGVITSVKKNRKKTGRISEFFVRSQE